MCFREEIIEDLKKRIKHVKERIAKDSFNEDLYDLLEKLINELKAYEKEA